MILCDYGCGQEAKYQFKNGKWCCSIKVQSCPAIIKKKSKKLQGRTLSEETKQKISQSIKGRKHTEETKNKIGDSNRGRKFSLEFKQRMSIIKKGLHHSNKTKIKIGNSNKGKKHTEETKKKIGNANRGRKLSYETRQKISKAKRGIKKSKKQINKLKLSIKQINSRYPMFSKIEELRYNPDKPGEKEIQVHCKNHNCPNSKEQGGWFTPSKNALSDRISCLDRFNVDHCYFYCSEQCKDMCPLYRLRSDPFKELTKTKYTQEEYQQFREYVLERDNYKCQYCGQKAEHVHHERPQKLEPFFALDPDYAWSVCKKCHYKYGHKDECSTGRLSNKYCKEVQNEKS
jgi:5-methylcytosine-specific restriction endonuclease McrA